MGRKMFSALTLLLSVAKLPTTAEITFVIEEMNQI